MGVTLDSRRGAHWHNVIARLKPGVSVAQAQSEWRKVKAVAPNLPPPRIHRLEESDVHCRSTAGRTGRRVPSI